MKTKIVLTKDQVDLLVSTEEKQLRAKFEKDLALLRKKYEVAEIEVNFKAPVTKTEKSKLTDVQFSDYLNIQKLNIKEIANLTGYNEAYLYKIKKRVLAEKS